MSEQTLSCDEPIDLTNCDREPIHVIGHIQPNGALLAVRPDTMTVSHASENAAAYFGPSGRDLLGRSLSSLLPADALRLVEGALADGRIEGNALHLCACALLPGPCDVVGHTHGGLLLLEIEPAPAESDRSDDFYYYLAKRAFVRMQKARTLQEYCQAVVEEIGTLTGFDRVMIYRFSPDGSGEVVAEHRRPDLEPFVGLHYPETDIPKQARALFVATPVRMIADVRYAPVPIVPRLDPRTGRPLDMSHASLRGVSPIHLEYLSNMGVTASMSLAIVHDGRLWGLIACHHCSGPRFVPYGLRTVCELASNIMSLQVVDKEAHDGLERTRETLHLHDHLVESVARQGFAAGMASAHDALLRLVHAGGAAVSEPDRPLLLFGATPPAEEIAAFLGWLRETSPADVFSSDCLAEHHLPAEPWRDTGAGVLAVRLSQPSGEYILWFRPETVRTVDWAGDPRKAVVQGPDGLRLSPRKSFALWKETVKDRSLPWLPAELDAAKRLRVALAELATADLVARRNVELARLNAELALSNAELDSFAYVASHDLKEPLRGIYNYASFLLEDYGDRLDEEGKKKLETLVRLPRRMLALIDSLLHFSRTGRSPLVIASVDPNEVVGEALEDLSALRRETNADVVVPRPLPIVRTDRLSLLELLTNLVSNAMKYSDRARPRVEIGYDDTGGGPVRFYVRDDGIGIDDKSRELIFQIFKRMHRPDEYGGGAGAGLTIVKKILQHLGGRIWVESAPGAGSTFWFTLSPEAGA